MSDQCADRVDGPLRLGASPRSGGPLASPVGDVSSRLDGPMGAPGARGPSAQPSNPKSPPLAAPKRVRKYFPETWLWIDQKLE